MSDYGFRQMSSSFQNRKQNYETCGNVKYNSVSNLLHLTAWATGLGAGLATPDRWEGQQVLHLCVT